MKRKGTVLTCSVMLMGALSGCSLLPYENQFACRKTDDFGKCISVDEAYQEAISGDVGVEPKSSDDNKDGLKLKKASEKKHRWFGWLRGNSKKRAENSQILKPEEPYSQYKDQVYRELATLIEKPKTPMLKPTSTIRTLILSYSPNSRNDLLFMPRYVYSIIDDPAWVLGEYLHEKNPSIAIDPWK